MVNFLGGFRLRCSLAVSSCDRDRAWGIEYSTRDGVDVVETFEGEFMVRLVCKAVG